MKRHLSKLAGLCAPIVLSLTGCMADLADSPQAELGAQSEALVPWLEIPEFDDPAGVGTQARVAQKFTICNAEKYKSTFGHAAPDVVDFGRSCVVFFSAGPQPTGGYKASFTTLTPVWPVPTAGTLLEVPGDDCFNSKGITHPYALGLVPRNRFETVRFAQTEKQVVDCGLTCEDLECAPSTHCEMVDIQCVTAPCPSPRPECVPDEEPAFCGGIAGIPCDDPAEECVDDPSDSCDPRKGGADCGGICVPSRDDPTPIHPCAATLCLPPTQCVVEDGVGVCKGPLRDPCANFECPEGQRCVAPADFPVCR